MYYNIFGCLENVPDKVQKNLKPKSKKCIFIGQSLEQKGYKYFNPSTQRIFVSRDVIFDESTSWYEPNSSPPELVEEEMEFNSKADIQPSPIPRESPISTRLSGPQEPPSDQSTLWPSPKMDTKGKAKMPEYEDSNGNESTHSHDSEYGKGSQNFGRQKKFNNLIDNYLAF